jgi:hypothetical protein
MPTIEQLAPALVDGGYEPLPITPGEKIPHLKNWSMIPVDHDQVTSWIERGKADEYVGLRCGAVIAIDVDVDDADVTDTLLADLEFALGDSPVRYGKPGRGLRIYRADGRWPKKSITLIDPDGQKHAVEVLAQGQQFVAYGIHPDSGRTYSWEGGDPLSVPLADLPVVSETDIADWLETLADVLPDGWSVGSSSAFDEDERFLLQYRPPRDESDMSPDELVESRALANLDAWVVEALPAARPYQDGFRVSSKALGRDLEEDLQLSPAGIYDFGEEKGTSAAAVVAEHLCNGDVERARGWLCERVGVDLDKHREDAQVAAHADSPLAKWEARIDAAQDRTRLEKIASAVSRDGSLSPLDRESLAGWWQAAYLSVVGQRMGVAVIRKTMAPSKRSRDASDMPTWCRGWYYTTHTDSFFQCGTPRWVSMQGFNALYQRELAPDDDGRRPSATRVALDDHAVPVVEVGVYAPQLGETFSLSGRECVNTFMPGSLPPADDVVEGEGAAAVEAMDAHIRLLAGGRPEVHAGLKDWLAFVVQNPGKKIRYAPVIKGIEGDGKSLLLQMLAACLGAPNVRSVVPQVLMTQFNGYAEGVCVVGLEEIRMAGHNRHDALNALKPLITNDMIDVHKKGQDSYNALNTANYITFTNHSDALPIGESDRRWFVVFTPWSSISEMERTTGEASAAYFDRLHGAIHRQGGALRRWLLDYELSPSFSANGPAPATAEKQSMRVGDMDDQELFIRDALESGGKGYGPRALSTRHLTRFLEGEALDQEWEEAVPKSNALARILKRSGWVKRPALLKWRGEVCRVWTKGPGLDSNEAIREELERTADGATGTEGAIDPRGDAIPF